MKRIAILGSTGSIGDSTLKVVSHLKGHFQVVALAARRNIDKLEQQIREFSPSVVAVFEEESAQKLRERQKDCKVLSGIDGLEELAATCSAEMVVSAMTGAVGIRPTLAAIESGKHIALANKEVLVAAGKLVMAAAARCGVQIIPVDSEHSAIFQCLHGENSTKIRRILLTASGGPFHTFADRELDAITPELALKHPSWTMGPKVTIDSSTLMNKGLEVLEAHWLFGTPLSQIEVVIHPQSVIHSMVEFVDGSMIAQMGAPDMVTPIQYALTYPERQTGTLPPFDFMRYPQLTFAKPNLERFRCLDLAYQAGTAGGTLAGYMNAANEVLVDRFLNGQITWKGISSKLEALMKGHKGRGSELEKIFEADAQARQDASIA